MSAIRVRCNKCGSVARVESSKEIGGGLKQLYCSCRNVECGHTFVMDLTFSHTLSPSALDLPDNVRARLQQGRISATEQPLLFAELAG
ncbi:MAG: hypothetical protein PWQ57_2009 [Desulfovibrionales bacterium]|jgi:hypothetical protein|nr:hypothetical protein [Desulfovibrionales bacterium]